MQIAQWNLAFTLLIQRGNNFSFRISGCYGNDIFKVLYGNYCFTRTYGAYGIYGSNGKTGTIELLKIYFEILLNTSNYLPLHLENI